MVYIDTERSVNIQKMFCVVFSGWIWNPRAQISIL